MLNVSWEALAALAAVIGAIVGMATAYLKIFVAREISQLKEWIRKEFVSRDLLEVELKSMRSGKP